MIHAFRGTYLEPTQPITPPEFAGVASGPALASINTAPGWAPSATRSSTGYARQYLGVIGRAFRIQGARFTGETFMGEGPGYDRSELIQVMTPPLQLQALVPSEPSCYTPAMYGDGSASALARRLGKG